MTDFNPSLFEDLDVEDLVHLPRGIRCELHDGNLLIMTPSSFWHKDVTRRLVSMLSAAGLQAFQDPGVRGNRPRDCRLPDAGVVTHLPPNPASYSNLAASYYTLVVEVVSRNSPNGECLEKKLWYAEHGIPEYWIAEETPDGVDDDAVVTILKLDETDGDLGYVEERTLLLSDLEKEYRG